MKKDAYKYKLKIRPANNTEVVNKDLIENKKCIPSPEQIGEKIRRRRALIRASREARNALNSSLEELKETQRQLILQQKLQQWRAHIQASKKARKNAEQTLQQQEEQQMLYQKSLEFRPSQKQLVLGSTN